MPSYLHRKYIDLIRDSSSKYVNWDPRAEIRVCVLSAMSVIAND